MDSELNLSSAESETPYDFVSIISKSKGRATHNTQAYSRPKNGNEPQHDKDGRPLLYCRYCPELSAYATLVITNFRRHLESKHRIKVDQDVSKLQEEIKSRLDQLFIDADSLGRTDEITR